MKKFLKKISYTLLPVWLVAVLGVCYFTLIVCPEVTGDIGRLAIIPFGHEYDERLEKNFIQQDLFTTVFSVQELKASKGDVVTIGDSFSERGRDGYQNYLGQHGLKVVNVGRYLYYSPVTYAYEMMDLGIIDSTNTSVLIVESVEREFNGFMSVFRPSRQLESETKVKKKMILGSANEWSLNRARDFIVYHSGLMTPPILKRKLSRDFFTSDNPSELYFYANDIKGTSLNLNDIPTIQATYRSLQDKAKEKHITLLLLVATDKYDLYQRYIVDNPYPEKTVNEEIDRLFNHDPHIILAKFYLQPLVDRGEKDVYLYNDTHWSYKAAKVVADELYNRIQQFK